MPVIKEMDENLTLHVENEAFSPMPKRYIIHLLKDWNKWKNVYGM